jgi:aryl-alcohol dehydrogenase-like predicted oxidoreductase
MLGRTGLEVSEIGFGSWGLGGDMWRGVDKAEGERAVHAALDLGVTFLDTALEYGDGESERMLAGVLAARAPGERARVVVATKVPPKNMEWPGRARAALRETFPARHIAACVEKSLSNLRLDALPLVQLHVWHDAWLDSTDWPATRETMGRLASEGKVRHWGVSVNDHAPETALRLLAGDGSSRHGEPSRDPAGATVPPIEAAQAIYNIFDRSPERSLFALARERGVGVIARCPFDEGALTGAIRADTTFPRGDWRAVYFRGDRKAEAEARADALRVLLGDEATSLAELALRFCLSRPEVSTVIPGMRRAEHARANAAVADGRALSPALLARLDEHAWEKNWYDR